MPFRESQRVLYGKNPLREVVCQLRFPPILRIEAEREALAQFQEQMRGVYPLYNVSLPKLPPEIPAPVAAAIQAELAASGFAPRIHEFGNEDRTWVISIARDVFTIQTSDYRRWEDFIAREAQAFQSFCALFAPAYLIRVALRYVNVICRSELGLAGETWRNLLEPHVAGAFTWPQVFERVENLMCDLDVRLSQNLGRVHVRHGTVTDDASKEQCFLIDSDFFRDGGRSEIQDASNILGEYNRRAGYLFRDCIKESLHRALEPREP